MSNCPPSSTTIVEYAAPQNAALLPFGLSLPSSAPFLTVPALTIIETISAPPNPVFSFSICRNPSPVFQTVMFVPPEIVTFLFWTVPPLSTHMSNTPPAADDITVNAMLPPTVAGGRRSLFPQMSMVAPDATSKSMPLTMS